MGSDPSGPMSWKSIALNFAPSAAPFTLWVRQILYGRTPRVTVWYCLDFTVKENFRTVPHDYKGWRFSRRRQTATIFMVDNRAFMSMPRVAFWLDFLSDRSVASSSVHSRYIYNTSQSSFLHFTAKTHCQSATVIFVRIVRCPYKTVDHTTVNF